MRTLRRAVPVLGVAALLGAMLSPAGVAYAAPGDFAWGTVTVDANKNGVLDASGPAGEVDRGLQGATVEILDATGEPVADTTTAADGTWSLAAEPAGTGPFTVRVTTVDANGNVYKQTSPAPVAVPADGRIDTLVYPVWKLDAKLADDPNGVGGRSIITGAGPWDANDTEPGFDSGSTNTVVRSADIVAFNWTLTVENEDGSLGHSFEDAIFEQTIVLNDGALANFASIPAVCRTGSQIVAHPSGTVIAAKADPPAGTTSITLSCVLGEMGNAPAPTAYILGTQVQPSAKSPNGSSFETESRFYAVDANGAATAQPTDGPEVPPIDITSAPRYDVEKINGDASGNYAGTRNGEPGTYSYYTVQISTDRKVGVEAFQQPITMEESFWALIPPPEGTNLQMDDLRWYLTDCRPTPAPNSGQTTTGLVYGKVGTGASVATTANAVRDSGTCTIGGRTGGDDTGSYQLSMSGIDTSGSTYPTQTVAGASLAAGPYYVASYRIQIFVPYSELDRTDGVMDGNGSLSLYNRVGDFDPTGISGASNFGSGVEPGYCDPGPNTDQAANCDAMEDDRRSNNVVGPHTKRISPGSWSKYFFDLTTGWRGGYTVIPASTTSHDGAGQVQPGQTFTSFQSLNNTGTQPMSEVGMCDVFDATMLKLVPLNQDATAAGQSAHAFPDGMYSAIINRTTSSVVDPTATLQADQANWVTEYGTVDTSGDDPDLGTFDTANDRWTGDWTRQKAATNRQCGDAAMTWYASPEDVPGGVDAVNAVRVRAVAGREITSGYGVYWLLALEQRDTYNGGPHAGEAIRSGTVAANFGSVRTSNWLSTWRNADYIPGAGTTDGGTHIGESSISSGDRWTVTRAVMRLQKRTVAGEVGGEPASGVSDYGVTGAALAGKPVIWEITPTLTASSDSPAPVQNVVVTDTLPAYVVYDEAGTQALATAGGFPVPSSATVNGDGTTTLVWNLGARTPNQDLPVLRIATHTDAMAPPNTTAINWAEITADGVVSVRAHRDDHVIRIEQSGQVQLKKSVDRTLDLQDDDQLYTLEVKNFSETLAIQPPTVYDVLPYNGDATNAANVQRNPESTYAGTNLLREAPTAFDFDGTTERAGTFYYTTVPGADVPQRQQDDTDPSIWSTTFTPDATGFKFVSDSALATTADASRSGIRITFRTDQADNDPGDIYTNRFTATSPTLNQGNQLLTSNTVSVRVVGFSVGDLVWIDVNANGRYDVGVDRPAPEGVEVRVLCNCGDEDGPTILATTHTDADGRWVVNDLAAGNYNIAIPSAEFRPGGLLEGYLPAPGAVEAGNEANGLPDVNEDVDHHAAAYPADAPDAYRDGVYVLGGVTLSADTDADPIQGLEPLNDNVAGLVLPPLTTDDFTNLTLDMALVPPGEFTVAKALAGDGADDYGTGPFSIVVTCTRNGADVAGYPRTVTFTGAGSETLRAPHGSVCTAVESVDGGATSHVVAPENGLVITGESAEQNGSLTATNTFDLGSLRVRKTTSGVGAALAESRTFDFSVTCSFNGTANAFTGTTSVTVNGAGEAVSEPVTGIPVGASCVVTETSSGGADTTPAPSSPVIIDGDAGTVQEVAFENVFSAGTVSVVKRIDGALADDAFLAGLSYRVQLTCATSADAEPLYQETLTLTPGTPVRAVRGGVDVLLPLGTHCWATETGTQGASAVTITQSTFATGAVVAAGNTATPQALAIEVSNEFEPAEITVSKAVVGPPSTADYVFNATCTYPVTDAEGNVTDTPYPLAEEDATFTLANGGSKTFTVPKGATCAVTEDLSGLDDTERANLTVTYQDTDRATEDDPDADATDGVVTDVEGGDDGVAVTNTFAAGTFDIVKTVTGSGAGLGEGAYTFDVVCTAYGQEEPWYATTVTLTGDGAGEIRSDVIDGLENEGAGLPVGAACVITEVADGGADATPVPVLVTIDDDPQTVQHALFTNAFSAGTVEIGKTLDGTAKDSELLNGLTYPTLLTCAVERGEETLELYSGIHDLVPGVVQTAQVEVEGVLQDVLLPIDTHCWAEELVSQGASTVTIANGSYESGAVVETGNVEAPQRLSLEVVNTFDLAELTVAKKVVGPDPGGPYSFELACTFDVTMPGGTTATAVPLDAEDASFALEAGQSRTVAVPAGATCQVKETNVPATATVGILDSDGTTAGGRTDGVVATITGTDNRVDVTNTFPVPTGTTPETGVSGGLVGAGVVGTLLVAGGLVLLALRRRRQAA